MADTLVVIVLTSGLWLMSVVGLAMGLVVWVLPAVAVL